ncbi:DUF2612 domain-containing protein [Paraburkholderia tropica]|uniref:DUF2612 domain-containing protein n=1 Tax=Paraburkholderia tropica TaxID=92647 RepID=UPI0030166B9B
MENYLETVLSQYGNSPTLLSLIDSFNSSIDPSGNIDLFYQYVWDITTAQGFGLDVWGRIVGVSRILEIPGGVIDLGFEEAGTASAAQFGQGVFYNGTQATSNFTLSDDAFRTLILAKALANISQSNIHAYNTILMSLFQGRGNAFVLDLGNMAMSLVFLFPLADYEIAIIKQSGAFTPPTGVGFNVMVVPTPTFGFAEAGSASNGFNQGTFFAGYS